MPAFDHLVLTTPRLRLRALEDRDAEALFAVSGDPEVVRFLSRAAWTGVEQAREKIARDREAMRQGEYVQLGIERVEDGLVLGDCCLFKFMAGQRRAEIGYSLRRDAWGHGYTHEATAALIAWGFGDLALHRIEADIDPRNTASARVLERHGFQREGLLRERWIVDGELSDSAIYGLLEPQWRARAASR
jgi:[ribosomal protein S5]-alanine N-acetyltransferase